MIEDIIARAYQREHPSRYANESGLSKTLALVFVLLLPCVSFCYNATDIYTDIRTNSPLILCVYYLSSSVANTANNSDGKWRIFSTENIPADQAFAKWSRFTVGLGYQSNGAVAAPMMNESTASAFGYNTPVSTPSAPVAFSYGFFPDICTAYSISASLFARGYRCPTYQDRGSDRYGYKYCNFTFDDLIADILNGTNVVWRQALLSSLSSIGASVLNIDTGVSELRPVLSDIKDINTSISSNAVEQSSLLRDINTNSSLAVSSLLDVVGGLDTLHDDNLANSIDSFLGDDTEAWCGLVDWAVQNGYFLEVYGLEYKNALRATDPQRKGRSYPIPDSHRRFFVKNQIKHSVVEAVKMRGKYQSLISTIVNGNTGPISSIGGTFNADVISHINNGNIERSDWRAELRQQLQDWKHSDETGILNVVDKVNRAVDSINRNLETQFPNSTNTQSFTQFVTNYVTKVITNSIERTGDNISSNVQDSAKQTRDLLNDTLFNPDYDGVNVRIKFPLRYQHTDEVNVHDEAVYNAMMDFINSRAFDMTNLFSHIDSLASNFSNDFSWVEWFDRWDPFATNVNWFISRYQDSDTTPILLDPFENGFSEEEYHSLPWFSRVEALLFHIAQIGTNSIISVTEDDMRSLEDSQHEFDNIGTNFVAASVRVVGLFNGIRDFADSMALSFGNLAAKSTNGVILLPAGSWIGEEPLILRVDTRVQDVCRIVSSCIWYLLAIILCWSVVSATWSKVCGFVRWLWSVMDI